MTVKIVMIINDNCWHLSTTSCSINSSDRNSSDSNDINDCNNNNTTL